MRRTLVPAALLLAAFAVGTTSSAEDVATPTAAADATSAPLPSADEVARAMVGPALRQPSFALPDAVLQDLRTRDWAGAAAGLLAMKQDALVGGQKGDWAFDVAWSLEHAGKAKDALPYLPLIDGADCVPADYAALVKGEALRDADQPLDALPWLEKIPQDSGAWPRAQVERAEVLRKLGRTEESFAIYEQLVARPDPSPGNEVALLALAKRKGVGSDDAYTLLRRLWIEYPGTDEAVEATKLLASYPTKTATWQEVGRRAERLMDKSDWSGAILETDRKIAEVKGHDADACRYVYARGRSQYKANKLTESIATFADYGEQCAGVQDPDYGARILYLKGQAQFRKNLYADSAVTLRKIAELYPKSSFADDGLVQAGYSLVEAGDLDGARKVWVAAMDEQPNGDTVPEAVFRLAFTLYQEGKPDEAREVAKKLGALPIASDAVDIAAGRYWAARLALYPDVNAPNEPVKDAARKQEAVDGWKSLCEDMPHSFYAILAYSRLVEEAPDVAKQLAVRPTERDKGDLTKPWLVRMVFLDDPAVRSGTALARLGLVQEARAEWARVDDDTMSGDEKAWLTELRIQDGDWLLAHDDMRQWMLTHPPGTLGEHQAEVLRVAYPDRYWPEVQTAAKGYVYDPRLFHALVREESNFNAGIISHAGARGLSQLMPTTAKQVAGWMKVSLTSMDQLNDPATNLKLGAKYLDSVHKQLGGSPYLSLAAYNAGAGRVGQWLGEWGNVPTDEFVERIPFRETRGYVKRVMGTWEVERYQFDDGDQFYDLSGYNHHAMKE